MARFSKIQLGFVAILSLLVTILGLLGYYLFVSDRLVIKDYSAFHNYQFSQQPGLGFCPDPNSVFAASIEHNDTGQYSFVATVQQPAEADDNDCLSGVRTRMGCMSSETRPSRLLSAKEVDRVKAHFVAVHIHPNPASECRTIGIDPCRIARHTWDAKGHDDYVCGTDRLPHEQSRSIIELLSSLRDAK